MGARRPWKSNRELHGWEKQGRQGDLVQRPLQGVELAPMGGKMAGRALENREGRHGCWGRLLQGSGGRPWLLAAEREEREGKKRSSGIVPWEGAVARHAARAPSWGGRAQGDQGGGRHSWELGCSSFNDAMDPGRLGLPCALRSREREPSKAGAALGKKGRAP
jgi:hypothetical protein